MVIKAILWLRGTFWVCKQLETYKIIKIVQAWIWFKYQTLWYFLAVFCFHSELNPSMFLIFPPEATSINSSSFHSVVPRLFASSAEDFHVACLNSPESMAIFINVSLLPPSSSSWVSSSGGVSTWRHQATPTSSPSRWQRWRLLAFWAPWFMLWEPTWRMRQWSC